MSKLCGCSGIWCWTRSTGQGEMVCGMCVSFRKSRRSTRQCKEQRHHKQRREYQHLFGEVAKVTKPKGVSQPTGPKTRTLCNTHQSMCPLISLAAVQFAVQNYAASKSSKRVKKIGTRNRDRHIRQLCAIRKGLTRQISFGPSEKKQRQPREIDRQDTERNRLIDLLVL